MKSVKTQKGLSVLLSLMLIVSVGGFAFAHATEVDTPAGDEPALFDGADGSQTIQGSDPAESSEQPGESGNEEGNPLKEDLNGDNGDNSGPSNDDNQKEDELDSDGPTEEVNTPEGNDPKDNDTEDNDGVEGVPVALADDTAVENDSESTTDPQADEPVAWAALYGHTLVIGKATEMPATWKGEARTDSWADIETNPGGGEHTQFWYNHRMAIRSVEIIDKIQPATTTMWFQWCENLTSITGLENIDMSRVISANSMFSYCGRLKSLDLSSWDMSHVGDVSDMFLECRSLETLDISSFTFSKEIGVASFFDGDVKLKTIYGPENFTVKPSADMFKGCEALVGGLGSTYSASDMSSEFARIDGVDGKKGYFTPKLTVSFENFGTSPYVYGLTAPNVAEPGFKGWEFNGEFMAPGTKILYDPNDIHDLSLKLVMETMTVQRPEQPKDEEPNKPNKPNKDDSKSKDDKPDKRGSKASTDDLPDTGDTSFPDGLLLVAGISLAVLCIAGFHRRKDALS